MAIRVGQGYFTGNATPRTHTRRRCSRLRIRSDYHWGLRHRRDCGDCSRTNTRRCNGTRERRRACAEFVSQRHAQDDHQQDQLPGQLFG